MAGSAPVLHFAMAFLIYNTSSSVSQQETSAAPSSDLAASTTLLRPALLIRFLFLLRGAYLINCLIYPPYNPTLSIQEKKNTIAQI